ncbi:MAG: hypothetical protein AB7V50_06895 [Vampirovibrionia bacterium]
MHVTNNTIFKSTNTTNNHNHNNSAFIQAVKLDTVSFTSKVDVEDNTQQTKTDNKMDKILSAIKAPLVFIAKCVSYILDVLKAVFTKEETKINSLLNEKILPELDQSLQKSVEPAIIAQELAGDYNAAIMKKSIQILSKEDKPEAPLIADKDQKVAIMKEALHYMYQDSVTGDIATKYDQIKEGFENAEKFTQAVIVLGKMSLFLDDLYTNLALDKPQIKLLHRVRDNLKNDVQLYEKVILPAIANSTKENPVVDFVPFIKEVLPEELHKKVF